MAPRESCHEGWAASQPRVKKGLYVSSSPFTHLIRGEKKIYGYNSSNLFEALYKDEVNCTVKNAYFFQL